MFLSAFMKRRNYCRWRNTRCKTQAIVKPKQQLPYKQPPLKALPKALLDQ